MVLASNLNGVEFVGGFGELVLMMLQLLVTGAGLPRRLVRCLNPVSRPRVAGSVLWCSSDSAAATVV